MNEKTIDYALQVLNSQRRHMADGRPEDFRAQAAYYDGMRRMFEIILTEAYTSSDYFLTLTKEGHKIMSYT